MRKNEVDMKTTADRAKEVLSDMSVRDILKKFPQTRNIFDKHGLSGCGGEEGPAEPLSFFARVHQVDAEALLTELQASIGNQENVPEKKRVASESYAARRALRESFTPPADVYKLFIKGALAFLMFGSLLGLTAMLLMMTFTSLGARSSFPWGVWWGHITPIHGHIQLFGFAALFIMGIAYHVVPRFLMTELYNAGMARASFYFMAAGVLLSMIFSDLAMSRPVFFYGAAFACFLEVASVVLFIKNIAQTVKGSSAKPQLHTKYLQYGSLWLFAGTLFYFLFEFAQAVPPAREFAPRFKDASMHIMLFGFIFLFISGVALRVLHLFLGLREPQDKFTGTALKLVNAGLVIFTAQVFINDGNVFKNTLLVAASALLVMSTLMVVYNLRIFEKPVVDLSAAPLPRDYEKYIRAAFLWLSFGVVLFSAGNVLSLLASQIILSQSLILTARHILTIGFMAQMTFGMASRIVPVFEGRELKSARILNAGFYLLNAGVLVRVIFQMATAFYGYALYPGVALSGTLHFIAFAFLSYNLWATMNSQKEAASTGENQPQFKETKNMQHNNTKDISANSIVWNVLNEYPQTLAIFVMFGFHQLKNPVLRNTMARTVTVEKACKMHNVSMEALLASLREIAGLPKTAETPLEKHPHEKEASSNGNSMPHKSIAGTEKKIMEALENCHDPEIPECSVVDMGMIFGVMMKKDAAHIFMTLTSPHCPKGGEIKDNIRREVLHVDGVQEVKLYTVLDPPWSPDLMNEKAKKQLGYISPVDAVIKQAQLKG